jgi:hypothetical protein
MVVNIVDVGWATSKSGCLPISGPQLRKRYVPEVASFKQNIRTGSEVRIPRHGTGSCLSLLTYVYLIKY